MMQMLVHISTCILAVSKERKNNDFNSSQKLHNEFSLAAHLHIELFRGNLLLIFIIYVLQLTYIENNIMNVELFRQFQTGLTNRLLCFNIYTNVLIY